MKGRSSSRVRIRSRDCGLAVAEGCWTNTGCDLERHDGDRERGVPPVATLLQSCAKSTVRTMCLCSHTCFTSPVSASQRRAEKSAEPVTPSTRVVQFTRPNSPLRNDTDRTTNQLRIVAVEASTRRSMPSCRTSSLRTCWNPLAMKRAQPC